MSAKYTFFTSRDLKPRGWLRRQLKLQAEGLCGNLDRVWPDVRDSAWVGGDREGWERVPYWLDGCIPMAYLLEDDDLIARVKRYVDHILARQEPDGWICPAAPDARKDYDTWAVLLISKVLVRYYECSQDSRIPEVLRRMMKNYHDLLERGEVGIRDWAKYRWFEGFPALQLLWKQNPENWIRSLARKLYREGMDYHLAEELWKRPLNKWTFDTHIVNLCMMLKSEVLSCDLLDIEMCGSAEHFYQLLKKYNGTAVGTFTGDEVLAGISPIHGTELCAVVELMDSMEQLYAYTGDSVWAERLERVSFNALPATISEDMWAHQYVQMVNQIDCTPFPVKSHFRTNDIEAHRFGLEPQYGCCTANFGQGWPKLALSAFLRGGKGIISAVPIPSEVRTDWKGVAVAVSLETDYPFRNRFVYRIEAAEDTDMALEIRLPSFAKNIILNGVAQFKRRTLTVSGFSKGTTVLELSFTVEPILEGRPHQLSCLRYGSLIFSYPVEGEWVRVEYEKNSVPRKYPYCDYDLKGGSDWNVAFANRRFLVRECEIGEIPFSQDHPPLVIETELCHIDWGYEDGFETVCASVPKHRKPLDVPAVHQLIPYGCARLRMTELPCI